MKSKEVMREGERAPSAVERLDSHHHDYYEKEFMTIDTREWKHIKLFCMGNGLSDDDPLHDYYEG